MIEEPIQEIMRLLGVDTEKAAIQRVEALIGENEWLNSLLNNLTVVPVVIANGRPLFAQMPPVIRQRDYPAEFLEMVRDSLIDSAAQMRLPILQSKQRATDSGSEE